MNLKFYEIYDGATHAVMAHDEAEAYGLYINDLVNCGYEWPEEKPSIRELKDDEHYQLLIDGSEESKLRLKVFRWRELIHAPQYIGCSEF